MDITHPYNNAAPWRRNTFLMRPQRTPTAGQHAVVQLRALTKPILVFLLYPESTDPQMVATYNGDLITTFGDDKTIQIGPANPPTAGSIVSAFGDGPPVSTAPTAELSVGDIDPADPPVAQNLAARFGQFRWIPVGGLWLPIGYSLVNAHGTVSTAITTQIGWFEF